MLQLLAETKGFGVLERLHQTGELSRSALCLHLFEPGHDGSSALVDQEGSNKLEVESDLLPLPIEVFI